jgi:hypothetical protein
MTTIAPPEHRSPSSLGETRRAALEHLRAGHERSVRVGIHDATRFQWTVCVPLPARGRSAYSIEVELEVPTNAVVRGSPWEQLQTFTRLDEAHRPAMSESPTIDVLRRGAVSLQRMLARAASGFRRHVAMSARSEAEDAEGDPYGFLVVWLEAALYAVSEARQRLTQRAVGDSAQVACERALVDEYASVALLEMLAEASAAVSDPPDGGPAPAALAHALARVRARVDQAIADEIAHRRASGFFTLSEPSPSALDAYVARGARLKKHFEEVLFLDRESYQLDERVQQWMTSLAALFAGGSYFLLQLVLIGEQPSSAVKLGSRLLAIVVLAGACYMARDRLKDVARAWLTGKVHRFHAQRVSRYRLPVRMLATRDVVIRTREWCNQSTQSQPDILNPEAGATLARTRIRYLLKGVVMHRDPLDGAGVSRVRHIFRYDVSPLLPRLADDVRRVPFVGEDGAVQFAEAPRRYQIPVSVRLEHGGETHEERATVVLEKRGITRLDAGVALSALAGEEQAADQQSGELAARDERLCEASAGPTDRRGCAS